MCRAITTSLYICIYLAVMTINQNWKKKSCQYFVTWNYSSRWCGQYLCSHFTVSASEHVSAPQDLTPMTDLKQQQKQRIHTELTLVVFAHFVDVSVPCRAGSTHWGVCCWFIIVCELCKWGQVRWKRLAYIKSDGERSSRKWAMALDLLLFYSVIHYPLLSCPFILSGLLLVDVPHSMDTTSSDELLWHGLVLGQTGFSRMKSWEKHYCA